LDASAGFSQISGVPRLGGCANLFLSWWNKGNRVLILPILCRHRSELPRPVSVRVSGEDATAGDKYFGILHGLDLSRFQFASKAEISDDAFCLA
jgi:hypothetical protein